MYIFIYIFVCILMHRYVVLFLCCGCIHVLLEVFIITYIFLYVLGFSDILYEGRVCRCIYLLSIFLEFRNYFFMKVVRGVITEELFMFYSSVGQIVF